MEKGIDRTNPKHIIGGLVFGLSLGLCYFSSTVYHWAKSEKVKKALRCLDHAAIYILIAGTYTPYLLFCVGDEGQYFWLPIIWTIAAVGVVLNYSSLVDLISFNHRLSEHGVAMPCIHR